MRTVATVLGTLILLGTLATGGNITLPAPTAAELLPGATGSYTAPGAPSVDAATMLSEFKAFVKTYPKRQGNHADHVGARNALAAELGAAGLSVWRQSFHNGIAQENICAAKIGSVHPTEWIVVGGHMDSTTWDSTVFAPGGTGLAHLVSEGAYDNGAGTRLTVALAKAFAPLNSAYSILFCAFDGEERGLQGSARVKAAMDVNGLPWTVDATRAMMNMDMFGINWPVRAPIYAEVRSDHTGLRSQIDAIRSQEGIPTSMFKFTGLILGQSDNRHWHQAGVPTVFYISDFQELGVPASNNVPPGVHVPATPQGAYPFWHHDDTYETMLVMAGGDAALTASFQVALNVASKTLAVMAFHPEIGL
jgi:Zn-dependent M28 family amino/carboxypeptidase